MKALKSVGKRALSLMLMLVLVLSLPLCINAATVNTAVTGVIRTGSCGTNVTYTLDTETGVLTISGTGDMENYSSYVNAPWYRRYRETIKSVVISDGVTSIGSYAFYDCSGLTSIEIPEGVTSIGEAAIRGCTALTSIVIPEGVTSISREAFSGCTGLTSIEIPEGVTSIEVYAFSSCTALTSIVLPETVTSIGISAFYNCKCLTDIKIPEGVTSIENYAFYNCTALTSIEIPEGVTSIGNNTFNHCEGLTGIKIPRGVTSIGDYAFFYCTALTSIVLPETITSIGESAFSYCKILTSIEIPSSVTSIGDYAFQNCTGLTSIEIPKSVTSIGKSAFLDCTGLTSIEIPETVTSIGTNAFYSCSQLKSAYIYNKDAAFGSDVFSGTPSDFTIYGYKDSTAQTYAEKNSHNFVAIDGEASKATLVLSYNNGQNNGKFTYDSDYTVSLSELAAPQKDKSVFTGWYLDSECTTPAGSQITILKGEKKTLYAGWKEVGDAIKAEAEDRTGSTATTSEFDLFGAQFREQTSSYTTGLRFCTRVSKSLISEIEAKTGSPAESGYVLSAKDNVLSDTKLEVGAVAANGKTVKENPAPKKYYDGKGYYVYTAVIVNIPDDMQSTDIVARPYIKYTDANGVLRYYYFTESGESNCGGGYYTSYTAVYNAYLAAQG